VPTFELNEWLINEWLWVTDTNFVLWWVVVISGSSIWVNLFINSIMVDLQYNSGLCDIVTDTILVLKLNSIIKC